MISRRVLLLAASAAAAGPPALAQTATPARLNPNTATAAQLSGVPGMTSALQSAILSGKPYASVVEFNAHLRHSLSEEQAKAVLVNVFVPVNLNTGTREQILLIPGMTTRMVREFLEYRPYSNMDQFNREIGKYVDAAEVARLRSYVTL